MDKAVQLIERGTVKEFKAIFEKPEEMMDVLVKDSLGLFSGTLLHYAVNYRKLSFVKYFIKLGADLESTLGAGHTPLYEAILSRSTTIAQHLIDAGANIHTTNRRKENLFYAITKMRYGDRSTTKVKLLAFLINLGLDVNQKNEWGRTILFDLVTWDEPKVLACLLESGADVTMVDKGGYTALHIAAGKGWVRICQMLLEKGADLNAQNNYAWTALDMATLNNKRAVMGFLGAEEAAFSENNIALETMQAALLEDASKVLALLPSLSNPNLHNYDQLSLLKLLVRQGAEQAVKMLLQKKNVAHLSDALRMACFKQSYSMVEMLLDAGADPNEDSLDNSVFYNLYMFAKLDDSLLKITQLLVDRGGLFDLKETGFRGTLEDLIQAQKSPALNTILGIL